MSDDEVPLSSLMKAGKPKKKVGRKAARRLSAGAGRSRDDEGQVEHDERQSPQSSSDSDSDDNVKLVKLRRKPPAKSTSGGEANSTASGQRSSCPSSSSSSSNKSEADGKREKPAATTEAAYHAANTSATKVCQSSGGDTSDTSIIDKDGPITPQKSPKKTSKRKQNDEEQEPKQQPVENVRLTKLKRYIRTAGLRCNYKQTLTDCTTDKAKIAKLEGFLEEKGLKGSLTLEACKQFRLRREQEKELADLNPGNIIADEDGPTLRSQRRRAGDLFGDWTNQPSRRRRAVFDEHDEDEDDEQEEDDDDNKYDGSSATAKREHEQLVSRLEGIVDSEGTSSD